MLETVETLKVSWWLRERVRIEQAASCLEKLAVMHNLRRSRCLLEEDGKHLEWSHNLKLGMACRWAIVVLFHRAK